MTYKSFAHVRARTRGGDVEDLARGGDDGTVKWTDRRYFSEGVDPIHRRHDREDGVRDRQGYRIFSER